MPLLLQPARARPARGRARHGDLGPRLRTRRRRSACCRCTCPAASLPRGATSWRSPPAPVRPASTPISLPRRSASPTNCWTRSPTPASIMCRFRSRTASRSSADHIAGYEGAFARKRALAAEVVRRKLPLTVNAVMHRANIEQDRRDGRSRARAWERAGSRSRMCSTTAGRLKNRAMLMPTPEQVERAAALVEELRTRHHGQHRHRRGGAGLLRALSQALRRRLGPTLAQRDAGGQGAALPCRGVDSRPRILERARSFARRYLGERRRRSTHSAAPPG